MGELLVCYDGRSGQANSTSDFGPIFAELLPGNFAKLQPPEGQDLTEGLEVKVRLGSVWKASLTELSGGQRYVAYLVLERWLTWTDH
jgi:chromosome segregation ATPase